MRGQETNHSSMSVTASDHWIGTPNGTLFARAWAPLDPRRDRDAVILLFHDSLGCVDLWRDFPKQLTVTTGRRVVAYDRLGFGRSDPHPGRLTVNFVREEAEVVPLLREAVGLDAIIPFGHSVGGAMAIAAAARWPECCPQVVTVAAQCFAEERTLSSIGAAKVEFERPGQMERLARYHGAKARWVLEAWTGSWLTPAFASWHLDEDLRAVRCPALVLHGDRDEYGSLEHPQRISQLIPGAVRVVIIEDCGHVPHREHPARVLEEVARFLDGPQTKRRAIG